jgi:hypothetical protein
MPLFNQQSCIVQLKLRIDRKNESKNIFFEVKLLKNILINIFPLFRKITQLSYYLKT